MPSFEINGEKVRHFRDIPPGWYKINYMARRGGDEYGVYRLQVDNRKGDFFNLWAPSCMGEFLESSQNIIWKYGFYKE